MNILNQTSVNASEYVQYFIDGDCTNDFNETIVVLFEEAVSAPYFLKQGERLPQTWVNGYEIKSVQLA
jgi:hypothetical protein